MEDLFDLLKEQIKLIPINKNSYFYNKNNKEFYYKCHSKICKMKTNKIHLLLTTGKRLVINKNRLLSYFQNGLLEGMKSILDNNFTVIKTNNLYNWVTRSEKLAQNNINKLNTVFQDHQELYTKDGYYDEGNIPYKYREGFYIVPQTNGTFAINPTTQEAVLTYSNEILIPQFHERGDRKFRLNSRLTNGKHTIIASRAIAFVTLSIPDRYKYLGTNIKEIVENLDVDHIDANPSNNVITNLQYLTRQENLIKKLNQECDPRVFPNTWLAPNGEKIRFRSFREASKRINCNLAAIEKIYKGWRKNNEINGWKLIEGKLPHPLENIYNKLEKMNIDRSQLTLFKKEYSVYDIENKEFHLFNTIDDLCEKFNIFVSGLETHIAMKGPLVPYKKLIIFPYRFTNPLLNIKYFDNFIKEQQSEKR